MTWLEWVVFIAAVIAGLWVMGAAIEKWFRSRGKDIFGGDDFSDMDPPLKR